MNYPESKRTQSCQQELDTTNHSVPLYFENQKNSTRDQHYPGWFFFFGDCLQVKHPQTKTSSPHTAQKKPLSALSLVRIGFTENKFFIYQNIAQQAKRGTIQKAGCLNDGSVKKAFSADSLRVTQSPSYTTALKEAHTCSESLLLIGLKRFLCFLMTTVTRITVGKDESTQNVQHLLHFSFSSMEKVYQAPQNTSGMYS